MDIITSLKQSVTFRRLQADLRQDPRKAKLLIVLLPLLGAAMIPIMLGGYPSKQVMPQRPVEQADETLMPPTEFDQTLRDELGDLIKQLRVVPIGQWKGSQYDTPFGDPEDTKINWVRRGLDDEAETGNAETEQLEAENHMPSATFLSSTAGNLAIINGAPYREGEVIGEFVIREIGLRSIVLGGEHREYTLKIPIGAGD